jgi:hypothetical protein
MERRDLLKMIAVLTGASLVGADTFFSGCNPASRGSSKLWSANDLSLMDEIAETILPGTSASPGAKAARTAEFMNLYVNDCYEENEQQTFIAGMGKIDKDCKTKTGNLFMDCNAQERQDFLIVLDKEAKEFNKPIEEKEKAERLKDKNYKSPPMHYFTYMKQLTLFAYFTSEIGYTKALRYEAVPGRYNGSEPYKKGDRAWA